MQLLVWFSSNPGFANSKQLGTGASTENQLAPDAPKSHFLADRECSGIEQPVAAIVFQWLKITQMAGLSF
jgi:hypothetical protein